MLNVKKTLTKIMENALQVQTVSQAVTLSANSQSYVDVSMNIPSGATVKAASLAKTPNPNWVFSAISSYDAERVRVSYYNTAGVAISGTYDVAVFYTI